MEKIINRNPDIKRITAFLGLMLFMFLSTSCESRDASDTETENEEAAALDVSGIPADGAYQVSVSMEGGSGKAYIESPAELMVLDGNMTAELVWSSSHYDYMLVNGIRYDNENDGGNSTFTIPVEALDLPLTVIGDTTAMSTPHEIEYTITLSLGTEPETVSGAGNGDEGIAYVNAVNTLSDDRLEEILSELEATEPVPLEYAKEFTISRIDGYSLLNIGDGDSGQHYLIVHDGDDNDETDADSSFSTDQSSANTGKGLIDSSDVTVLYQPIDNTYLVSSSVMDFMDKLGCIENIRLSGIKESDWYIDNAVSAMECGDIVYAGKYSAPDYELILSEECDLAIENTMIYHSPEVKEKLEELGIPVMVERSSYEDSPLGRLEWIKVYGELFGKEKEALEYFDSQAQNIEDMCDQKNTGKSIAFFSINTNGAVVVRKPGDYIAEMIDMSGGSYALDDLKTEDENALSTMNLQFEDFYAKASEADILIYNSSIEGEISSIADLISKNSLFNDFKAVKTGDVYCCRKNFYQQSTGMADFMKDINNICIGSTDGLTYLEKLE